MPSTLAVVSFSDTFYTTRRLIEASRALGYETDRLDPLRCVVRVGHDGPPLQEDGKDVPVPDLVVPRVGAQLTDWGLSLLTALIGAGARCPVEPDALRLASDKLATAQRLVACGVPVVPTVAVRELLHIRDAIDAVGGPPIVLKLRSGTQGNQVSVAPDIQSATSVIGTLVGLGHTVLLQPRIRPEPPRDLRVLVIGGKAVAACWRTAPPGDFRTNVHRGGTTELAELTESIAAIATTAARSIGLALCGVDLLETDDGLRVLEVNGSPGIEGIEGATGRDLATPIIESLESIWT